MAASKAPAFQFYAAEYLADENVQLLTLEQEGIYIRLLAYCWREGSIPADSTKLSRLCKNAPLEALADVTDLFEASTEGRMIHRRLEDARRKHEEYRLQQVENGKEGGRPKKNDPNKSKDKGSGYSDESQDKGSGYSDESKDKGSGICDESETEAEKRSSSSSASASAFASATATASEYEEPNTLALTALAVPAVIVGTLPLNTGDDFEITDAMVREWIELYPGVDVNQQLRSMKGWCRANPSKRKTKSGIRQFINGWLSKEQNKARPMTGEINHGTSTGATIRAAVQQQSAIDAIRTISGWDQSRAGHTDDAMQATLATPSADQGDNSYLV